MTFLLICILLLSTLIKPMKFSLIMKVHRKDLLRRIGTCCHPRRSRILRPRNLRIGMTVPRLMILKIPNPRTGTNPNMLPTPMPPNPKIGTMRWTANGNPQWLITVITRVNGNQGKLTTLNTKENGFTPKSITLNTTLRMPKLWANMMSFAKLVLIYGKSRLVPFLTMFSLLMTLRRPKRLVMKHGELPRILKRP